MAFGMRFAKEESSLGFCSGAAAKFKGVTLASAVLVAEPAEADIPSGGWAPTKRPRTERGPACRMLASPNESGTKWLWIHEGAGKRSTTLSAPCVLLPPYALHHSCSHLLHALHRVCMHSSTLSLRVIVSSPLGAPQCSSKTAPTEVDTNECGAIIHTCGGGGGDCAKPHQNHDIIVCNYPRRNLFVTRAGAKHHSASRPTSLPGSAQRALLGPLCGCFMRFPIGESTTRGRHQKGTVSTMGGQIFLPPNKKMAMVG